MIYHQNPQSNIGGLYYDPHFRDEKVRLGDEWNYLSEALQQGENQDWISVLKF